MDCSLCVTTFLTLTVAVCYYLLTKSFSYWKKRKIVYEEPCLLFGNFKDAILMKKCFPEIIGDIYKKFPNEKVVGMFNRNTPTLLVRDPEFVHKIMVSDFYSFTDNELEIDERADPAFARNIFVLKGERWKKERQMITPAFTISKVKQWFDQIDACSDELVQYISQHPEELQLKHVMARYTSEVVARCGLGVKGDGFSEDAPFHRVGIQLFEPNFWNGMKQLIIFIIPKLSILLKIKFVPQSVYDFFTNIMNDIIKDRTDNNQVRNDVLQYLIDMKKKSKDVANGLVKSDIITREMDDTDILIGLITFFVDGYETSSISLNHVLYELVKNPDVQEKLRREINEELNKNNGKITVDLLTSNQMPLLGNVINEGLRLHPALQILSKICTKKYQLDLGDGRTLTVEQGTPLQIPVLELHRDPKYYDDPDAFNPDRFLDPQVAKRKGLFLPFGDGPRICIGMRVALVMLKLALIKIVTNFEVKECSKTPKTYQIDPNHFLRAHKGGIYAKFVKI